MRLTADNKQKVQDRIVAGAAQVLRQRGYDGVNIDRIMQAAGLTRGAFYAHFTSKGDLFAHVLRREHPLLAMLAARTGADAQTLRDEMIGVFREYLDPQNLDAVFEGCTLAALTGDASRADAAARQGYEAGLQAILAEMQRGQQVTAPDQLRVALVLASGAVTTARACDGADMRAAILTAARGAVDQALRSATAQV